MTDRKGNEGPFISERGNELILHFYNAIRSVMAARQDISALRQNLEGLFKKETKVSLGVRNGRLFLNDRRIEMRTGHMVGRILLKEFKRRRIGSIQFLRPPDSADLETVLEYLANNGEDSLITGEALQRILEVRRVESVRIEGAGTDGQSPEIGPPQERRIHHTRVYFYGMELMRGEMARVGKDEPPDMRLPLRVVRSLISGYKEAPAYLMSLATMKLSRGFPANHAVNVAIYAIALGHRLGLSSRFLTDLGLAALFHDVGEWRAQGAEKGGEGDLTEEEWRAAKLHPAEGIRILTHVTGIDDTTAHRLVAGIFGHHIGYNRSGFPKVRRMPSLSLVAEIVSLADFYDVATRPYGKRRFPCFSDRTAELIMERAGREFNPILAKYFLRVVGILPVGTVCRLSTGEIGVVCSLMEEGSTGDRPWVRLLFPRGRTYRAGDHVWLESVDKKTGKYHRSVREIVDPDTLGIDVSKYLVEF